MFPIFIKNFFSLFKRINKVLFPKITLIVRKRTLLMLFFVRLKRRINWRGW